MKSKIFKRLFFVSVVLCVSLALWFIVMFGLGGRYWSMDGVGQYFELIMWQPEYRVDLVGYEGSIFLLPEQYEFYGRFVLPDKPLSYDDMIALEFYMHLHRYPLVLYDRMVSREFLRLNNQIVYFYFTNDLFHFNLHFGTDSMLRYHNAYCYKTGEIVFSLGQYPRGLFIVEGTHLYYSYGEEHQQARFFQLGHNPGFRTMRMKDSNFARMNLNTFENEKITRKEYEEKYKALYILTFCTY
jgi:hypothetical protein